jgi:hypothetical protein
LSGNPILGDLKIFKMEIDSVWDMAFEVVEKRTPHVDDTNRAMVDKTHQFLCLDKFRVINVFKERGFGIEGDWKKKEEGE